MPRVDIFATEPHYLDHIAPVWKALPEECRGRVITTQQLASYAHALGLETTEHADKTHVLVAGWVDVRAVYLWDNVILMEHGIGQSYIPDETSETWAPNAYAGGEGRDGIRLFLCPNQRAADLDTKNEGDVVVIGDPFLDQLERDMVAPNVPTVFDVAFSWHWDCNYVPETMSAFSHYAEAVAELRSTATFAIAGTSHPRVWNKLRKWYQRNDIFSVQSLSLAIQAGRTFACDNSSAMFYAAAVGRPVIVLNAPWYRRGVEHGGRFWEHADVGWPVDEPNQLESAVQHARSMPTFTQERAQAICADLFPYRDGQSARRGAEAICGIF